MECDDRRRSFSQVVIGFSEEQSEVLRVRDQEETFLRLLVIALRSTIHLTVPTRPSDHRFLAATSAVMRRRISITASCHP